MKRILPAILFLFFTPWLHATIKNGADRIINQVSPTTNIGIEVFDLTSGATLYSRNQNKMFVPASNMKLFSDAAALMVLGPDYRFKNSLSTKASQLQNGVLKGSLYLKLSGDPSFSRERLANLLESLHDWNIHHIQGNVIIDSTHANVTPYAPGWMVSDLAYSYGAPLAPVMIDANRMVATVNPSAQAGEPAIVEVDDASGSVVLNNQAVTRDKGARCGVSFVMDKDNHLNVHGCIGVGQWAIQQKMAIRNPLAYAQGLIRQLLAKENIVLDGQVILGKTPEGAMLLRQDYSKPIAQIMADTLKPSDNLFADSLFLHAADKLNGAPVNWPEAQQVIKKFLQQQTGIVLQDAILTDGSGLSRKDLITAEQTVSLLRFLYERFPLAYEYIAALPVSGRDGTLQRRFKRPDQQDMVRAKTGTMTGIVSLSGYLYTVNGHTLAFAMYINNLPGTSLAVSGKYRYLIDALCSYFLQQKPSDTSWARVFSRNRIKYQLNPTQAEQQRGKQAKWRRLETIVKQAIRGQSVAVIYRGNELILRDRQTDVNQVLNALLSVRKKYPFAIALMAQTPLLNNAVLWMEPTGKTAGAQRVWIIREAV